jgi:hypothetical protein
MKKAASCVALTVEQKAITLQGQKNQINLNAALATRFRSRV